MMLAIIYLCAHCIGTTPPEEITRIKQIQSQRNKFTTGWAQYTVTSGKSDSPEHETTVYSYYHTENTAFAYIVESNTSTTLILSSDNKLWMYYKEAKNELAFLFPMNRTTRLQELLRDKQFFLPALSEIDQVCQDIFDDKRGNIYALQNLNLQPVDRKVTFRPDGFDIHNASAGEVMQQTITYRFGKNGVQGRNALDKLTKRIKREEVNVVTLKDRSTFLDAIDLFEKTFSRELRQSKNELLSSCKGSEFLLPKDYDEYNIEDAAFTGKRNFLEMTLVTEEKKYSLLQYKVNATWDKNGKLTHSPIPDEMVTKRKTLSNGEMLLLKEANGAFASTYFIHKSGQLVLEETNVFDDEYYCEFIENLATVN